MKNNVTVNSTNISSVVILLAGLVPGLVILLLSLAQR